MTYSMGSNTVTDFTHKPEHNTSNGKLHFLTISMEFY